MADIPQPSNDPYSVGDLVQIYIGSDDRDVQYNDEVCEIIGVFTDDLDSETGRHTDAYSYTLRNRETEEELPISFRHHDLVPADDGR